VRERTDLIILGFAVDKNACIAVCSYFEPDTGCANVVVHDNIAAGCKFAGFVAPGHKCANYETAEQNFKGNVAHSVSGHGARLFRNPSVSEHATCWEGSYFSAYKNTE